MRLRRRSLPRLPARWAASGVPCSARLDLNPARPGTLDSSELLLLLLLLLHGSNMGADCPLLLDQ